MVDDILKILKTEFENEGEELPATDGSDAAAPEEATEEKSEVKEEAEVKEEKEEQA
jgi:hypothetical protein